NMDTRLNFVPKMNPERLVEGYRSILRRIYNPEAYFERARRFLEQIPRSQRTGTARRLSDYRALLRSMWKQGLFSESRWTYWTVFLQAATRYRHAFDRAIMLAIMGHHFQTLTRIVCGPEPEPEMEQ